MIKSLLFTSFLAFSSGSTLLINKAPFKSINNQSAQFEPQYYTDYIDLYFFDNINLEFVSAAGGSVNFFRVTGYTTNDKIGSYGLENNTFKYWRSVLYNQSPSVELMVSISNDAPSYLQAARFTNERLSDTGEQVDKHGFSLVTDYYSPYIDDYAYHYLTTSWLDFGVVNMAKQDYKIVMTIPYNASTPPGSNWQDSLMTILFFNQNYYDWAMGFIDNHSVYQNGYVDGFVDGNNDGLGVGYDNGYNDGYNAALAGEFNSFGWLTAIFSAMGGLLGIQLLPGVSIGGIAILVMVLTLLPFLIGLLKGGKD